jgi:hypothetical protein
VSRELVRCTVRRIRSDETIAEFTTDGDVNDDPELLRRLLVDAVLAAGWPEDRVGEFEMRIQEQDGDDLCPPFRTAGGT